LAPINLTEVPPETGPDVGVTINGDDAPLAVSGLSAPALLELQVAV
jgi:hypothetical protein